MPLSSQQEANIALRLFQVERDRRQAERRRADPEFEDTLDRVQEAIQEPKGKSHE